MSGICIFNLSAKAAEYINNGEISLDTAPTLGKDELYGLIKSTAAIRASLPCEELLTGIYHKRVGQAMLKKAGIPFSETCGEISDKNISVLCNLAKDSRYPIRNVSDWSLAQITCGGIPARFPTSWNPSRQAACICAVKYSISRANAADIILTGRGKADIPQA